MTQKLWIEFRYAKPYVVELASPIRILSLGVADVVNTQSSASEALTSTAVNEVLGEPGRFGRVVGFAGVDGDAVCALDEIDGLPAEADVDAFALFDFLE
jgi:hypothetical protein